jgi:hypothetical protein
MTSISLVRGGGRYGGEARIDLATARTSPGMGLSCGREAAQPGRYAGSLYSDPVTECLNPMEEGSERSASALMGC